MRTAVSGTLLFDAGRSERELGVKYTDIRVAFTEAVDSLDLGIPELPPDQPEAARSLLSE